MPTVHIIIKESASGDKDILAAVSSLDKVKEYIAEYEAKINKSVRLSWGEDTPQSILNMYELCLSYDEELEIWTSATTGDKFYSLEYDIV